MVFFYLNILYFPLIGAIVVGFFGKYFNKIISGFISVSCIGISLIITFLAFKQIVLLKLPYYFTLFTWIKVANLNIDWGFHFDTLTVSMLIVVNLVSFVVHLYSIDYMKNDPYLNRFLSYISLFTFFMLILITADNLVQLFLGWEGVGLCSFLLISFWFTRGQAIKSALKAFILNRIGDLGLTLGIAIIFSVTLSVDFESIFTIIPYLLNKHIFFFSINFNILNLTSYLLFIGAIGKSAQVGLHIWLPDAMEGPTPVSALIHAATMVTAGVFLIIRCSPIFEYAPNVLIFMTIIGSFTCLFAATVGLAQLDIKKVIAYSTCSQLGYMIFTCGLSSYDISFCHLANHAGFKGLLFLCSGGIIHANKDEQNMHKLGGLLTTLPFIYSTMVLGSLALAGFPYLAGYYSKDIILENAYINSYFSIDGSIPIIFGTISAALTAAYSIRTLELTFYKNIKLPYLITKNIHEVQYPTIISLLILSIFSIFSGYFWSEFSSFGTDIWNNAILKCPINTDNIIFEYLPLKIKMLPLFIGLLSSLIYLNFIYMLNFIFIRIKITNFIFLESILVLIKKHNFDLLYNRLFGLSSFTIATFLFSLIDKGLLEKLGAFGINNQLNNFSLYLSKMQCGILPKYLHWMFTSSLVFLIPWLYFAFNFNLINLFVDFK